MKLNFLGNKDRTHVSLDRAEGLMVLIGADGSLYDQSLAAAPLVDLWTSGDSTLKKLVTDVAETGVPSQARIAPDNGPHVWVAAAPVGKDVFVVANDTTRADQVMEALVESRKLLRNLIDIATEFAFEVDDKQHFTFVSPDHAFECDTMDWLGEHATKIFWPDGKSPARNPFDSRSRKVTQVIETKVGGQSRQVIFSLDPVISENGTFLGVRGTCRDVTGRLEKLQEAKLDSLRLAVQQKITRHLNATENAQELMENASQELVEILRADLVWSIMNYDNRLVPAALCGEFKQPLNFEDIWARIAQTDAYIHQIEHEGRMYLVVRLLQGRDGIGMVIISRDTAISPWSAQELQLLEAIGDVLTAAFSKAQLIERLYRLSGKDDLTGLFNRRALVDVVERRLKLQEVSGKSGCLMFIDLDNFKEVNDTLGHDAGDKALQLTAAKLEKIVRSSDVAGRFGGDEFVVWLEEAGVDAAQKKAQQLLDYMPAMRAELGNVDLKLGASIGICASVPGVDSQFTDLTKRADKALYDVKKTGKNNIAIAPLPEMMGSNG